jgi:hypothetical protein
MIHYPQVHSVVRQVVYSPFRQRDDDGDSHRGIACALTDVQDKADGMIAHLASLAEQRLIISFAPNTLAYSLLKRVGELFPGPSKVREGHRALV